jgi:hypothetical protein
MNNLPNVIRMRNFSYFIYSGRKYKITKIFIHHNPKRNVADANDYMMEKNGEEGVIWASSDKRRIVICRNDDLGTEYIPDGRRKK